MRSLIESLADRVVGTVEEVAADRISVLLDLEAPTATALNTAYPQGFPRIHSYLLIPNEVGATIGWITSVKIERLPYPKRKGMQDFGLVDLPYPCRVVGLIPLGTLAHRSAAGLKVPVLEVRRGVDVFPSVGDPVLLPTREQLRAVVEGESRNARRRILIGHCPTAADAPVYIDPDKLFGRHLAILGNTGAGKSCSAAGFVRWAVQAAKNERERCQRSGFVNARFVVLDPNGEYARAFTDCEHVRLFQVEPQQGSSAESLRVPAWLWNGEEWAAFTGASPGVQRPILFEALRRLRSGSSSPDPFDAKVRGRVSRCLNRLKVAVGGAEHQGPGKREGFADILRKMQKDLQDLASDAKCVDASLRQALNDIAQSAGQLEQSERTTDKYGQIWHREFSEADIEAKVQRPLASIAQQIGVRDDASVVGEDIPRFFPVDELPDYVEALASDSSTRDLAQFVDSLNLRIRGLLRRGSLSPILNPTDSASIGLGDWLADHIGADGASNGQIAIIDLSLVPSEVIHIVIAVLARLTFEALQRYRRHTGRELPTVLVLEEAHSFVHRDLAGESAPAAGRTCCRVFERIAREGRKFGLGLVLASQRPSELSETVLSQCNTFLLHRLVNDRDQDLVRRLVPDGLAALLREIPNLPSRRAILLGWAAPAPVLVEIEQLPEHQRPHSPDPAFWDVWTGEPERGQRPIDWDIICRKWTSDDVEGDQSGEGDDSAVSTGEPMEESPGDVSGGSECSRDEEPELF